MPTVERRSFEALARKVFPSRAKGWLKTFWKEVTLYRAIRSIEAEILPDTNSLAMLAEGWGNQGFAANPEYLCQVAKLAATTDGPILECGSGLTTVLLGLLAGRRGVEVWSLEHIPEWHDRVTRTIRRHRLPVNCVHAALLAHADFDWYDAPDDAERPGEKSIIERWQREFGVTVSITGNYASIHLRKAA